MHAQSKQLEVVKSVRPLNMDILNDKDRVFNAWITVETVDKDNTLIPVDQVMKTLVPFMKRGGFVSLLHSNKIVGKLLNYEKAIHPEKQVPAIRGTFQVFDDYKIDNSIWDTLKSGNATGVSIGGGTTGYIEQEIDGRTVKVPQDFELYEISIVPNITTPINPYATIEGVNFFAKADTNVCPKCMEKSKDKDGHVKPSGEFKKEKAPGDKKPSKFGGCVNHMMGQGKSQESAERICGYIKNNVKKGGTMTNTDMEKKEMENVEPKQEEVKKSSEQEKDNEVIELVKATNDKLDKLVDSITKLVELQKADIKPDEKKEEPKPVEKSETEEVESPEPVVQDVKKSRMMTLDEAFNKLDDVFKSGRVPSEQELNEMISVLG